MAKTIEDVVAEAEIRDVHLRYCRANDRRDAELMRGCFHPDAVTSCTRTWMSRSSWPWAHTSSADTL
jgi:hypothetical protein